jgi:hypothetical protein
MTRDKYDSTGAMAAAWFGTPGAGAAIERVFGPKEEEAMSRTSRKPRPGYTVERHLWLAKLQRTPNIRRMNSVVGYQCMSLGWTRWVGEATLDGERRGEELTPAGQTQLDLWNHEYGRPS